MTMYAQFVQGGAAPGRRAEMDQVVTDEMIPALRDEPGFGGALNLVDRQSGDALMIVLWETVEQAARPLSEYGSRFLQALAHVMEISSGQRAPISVWEVNARV
jgi:hypothetical protein